MLLLDVATRAKCLAWQHSSFQEMKVGIGLTLGQCDWVLIGGGCSKKVVNRTAQYG